MKFVILTFLMLSSFCIVSGQKVAGTKLLTMEGDLAKQMVEGIHTFLDKKTEESIKNRNRYWQRDFSSTENYVESVNKNREDLAKCIGAVDPVVPDNVMEFIGTSAQPALVGESKTFQIFRVRWDAFGNVHGEGLMLVPKDTEPVAHVVAIPDANQLPEMLAGIEPGVPVESQFARILAESGCLVIIPVLMNRDTDYSVIVDNITGLTHREFLYRSAYELGRHIIGYEVQKVLSVVDWCLTGNEYKDIPVGVIGYGEGGLIALYSGALDPRIMAVGCSGYFGSRNEIWKEPIYRNVFGLLDEFGDAEIASLIAPNTLIVEACDTPHPPVIKTPGEILTPAVEDVKHELNRAKQLTGGLEEKVNFQLVVSGEDGRGPFGTIGMVTEFLSALSPHAQITKNYDKPVNLYKNFDPEKRLERQFNEINNHTQDLLARSESIRDDFWSKADDGSVEEWKESTEWYRDYYYNEIIGKFSQKRLPPEVRTRKIYDEPHFEGFEVVMDVFPDVFAYGVLLVPKNLNAGEQRPVVVCQHGLEGRPDDASNPDFQNYAKQFAIQLTEQGFITYSPQNPYIFGDAFRSLQRKLNPLKKTLYSVIIPQHEQTVNWLSTLPYVDSTRIGFYGISYGGKTAMRVTSIVQKYALSICSADFNEWIWKNSTTRSNYSYVGTGEYEMFEFGMGMHFNYAEIAGLIAPRPFMVERGHYDDVSDDAHVAYEYAKVRKLYADLNIPERTTIEFFKGLHEIHAIGTAGFLRRHLNYRANAWYMDYLVNSVTSGEAFVNKDISSVLNYLPPDRLHNWFQYANQWLDVNGEAIYQAEAYVHQQDGYNIKYAQSTKDTNYVYAFVSNVFNKEVVLNKVHPYDNSKVLLLGNDTPLNWKSEDKRTIIKLDQVMPDNHADMLPLVIKLKAMKHVKRPEMSPTGGTYFDKKTVVEIKSSTPGAEIRYTCDGSIPNETSPVYGSPVVLKSSATIRARAFKTEMVQSDVVTSHYTILDKEANGLNYSYYEGNWIQLPDFTKITPVKSGSVYDFSLESIHTREDHFAIRYSGYIKLPHEDEYTFYTYSDDGSKLFIDGIEVVNNDGSHSALEKSGSLYLKSGFHRFELEYFEDFEGQILQVFYSTPGIKKTCIPPEILYPVQIMNR